MSSVWQGLMHYRLFQSLHQRINLFYPRFKACIAASASSQVPKKTKRLFALKLDRCDFILVLSTANLHSIPQPQNSNGWSASANPQVCGTFAVIFCTSATANDFLLPQPQMTFYFRKLEPQTVL